MFKSSKGIAMVVITVVSAAGCGDRQAPGDPCIPGAVEPCVCPDGSGSTRTCDASETWGECAGCAAAPDRGLLDAATEPDALSPEVELGFDDGTAETAFSPWELPPGGQAAVVFAPPYYPATLERVRFFVWSANGIANTPFRVRVYGATSADAPPGEDLLPEQVVATGSGGWVEVDLSAHHLTITKDMFFVAMEWLTGAGDQGQDAQHIGVDLDQPRGRSWVRFAVSGTWNPIQLAGRTGDRNLMIRAVLSR